MEQTVKHRCTTARVKFVDQAGNAIANKHVHFELKKHRFLFGCGAFDSIPLTNDISDEMLPFYDYKRTNDKEYYADRMRKWLDIFNYATLPFYWGDYEPTEGNPQYETRMNAADFMLEHNVTLKGHPLCWHTVCAPWLMEYDNKTILNKQLARIEREVTAFKGKIDKWDVVNEAVIMPVYDRYDNAITRICKEYGRVPLIKELFAAARAANPSATLLINDFNLSDDYRKLISDCLDAGVSIDAIGIQTHQHQGYKGMAWLDDVLKRFSVFGLPLHFTENTLVSGEIMPAHIVDLNDYVVDEWPSTPEGEQRQAKEWEEMYVRLFNEPLVEAITAWDFADGAWLKAPSGIIHEDGSIKPVYHTLKDYVHNKWHTSKTLVTDEDGYAEITGYRGSYEIKEDARKGSFVLDTDMKEQRITLK
ncbi:MAG: endo-1,4-beta-xylanase [Eubacteriales bacterium]|nr:endo-1,4-beta-xylanase [Lachnospiraceae bacterium]MDO5127680.1 endo-1,4-beta-xylanase [Eubacteriales bacterium]